MCWTQEEIDNALVTHLREQLRAAQAYVEVLEAKYERLAVFAQDNAGPSPRPRRV